MDTLQYDLTHWVGEILRSAGGHTFATIDEQTRRNVDALIEHAAKSAFKLATDN